MRSERDMPRAYKRVIEKAVDALWPEVRVELKAGLVDFVLKEHAFGTGAESHPSGAAGSPGSGRAVAASGMPPLYSPRRWRAFFLHHFLPHDKGGWTKLRRDPWFGALALLTMVPVYGVRVAFHAVLLLCLAVPGAHLDEFQLVRFGEAGGHHGGGGRGGAAAEARRRQRRRGGGAAKAPRANPPFSLRVRRR